jgi:hypothetical protein
MNMNFKKVALKDEHSELFDQRTSIDQRQLLQEADQLVEKALKSAPKEFTGVSFTLKNGLLVARLNFENSSNIGRHPAIKFLIDFLNNEKKEYEIDGNRLRIKI